MSHTRKRNTSIVCLVFVQKWYLFVHCKISVHLTSCHDLRMRASAIEDEEFIDSVSIGTLKAFRDHVRHHHDPVTCISTLTSLFRACQTFSPEYLADNPSLLATSKWINVSSLKKFIADRMAIKPSIGESAMLSLLTRSSSSFEDDPSRAKSPTQDIKKEVALSDLELQSQIASIKIEPGLDTLLDSKPALLAQPTGRTIFENGHEVLVLDSDEEDEVCVLQLFWRRD